MSRVIKTHCFVVLIYIIVGDRTPPKNRPKFYYVYTTCKTLRVKLRVEIEKIIMKNKSHMMITKQSKDMISTNKGYYVREYLNEYQGLIYYMKRLIPMIKLKTNNEIL